MIVNNNNNRPKNIDGKPLVLYNGKENVILNPFTQQRTEFQGDGISLKTNGAELHLAQPLTATHYSVTGSSSGIASYDSFNRPDDLMELGFADTGEQWLEKFGTFGVTGNKAYITSSVTAGYNLVILNSCFSDCEIQVTCTGQTTQQNGLVFRSSSDGLDFYAVAPFGGNYGLYQCISGTLLPLPLYPLTPAISGDVLDIILSGINVAISINNVVLFIPLLPVNIANTYHGLFSLPI